jgi:hypothetical protein
MLQELVQGRSFGEVLDRLCDGRRVYALQGTEGRHLHLVSAEAWNPQEHVLGAFRPVETLKELFFEPRRDVGGSRAQPIEDRIVLGVKACDLASLTLHDAVFRDSPPPDPFYTALREHTLVVSCDCTDCLDVCFCTAMGKAPHPERGFDINLSPLPSGVVFETGSARGEEALRRAQHLLTDASEQLLQERETARRRMRETVAAQAARHGMTPDHDYRAAVAAAPADAALWADFAETCVECGACNFSCCTCHCFLLCDGFNRDGLAARTRQWDSCLFQNFARMAGGGNPRDRRAQRLHNRFEKKFVFFKDALGSYACNGCGRCIEACIGKIDLRDVLKRAVDEHQSVLVHAG